MEKIREAKISDENESYKVRIFSNISNYTLENWISIK